MPSLYKPTRTDWIDPATGRRCAKDLPGARKVTREDPRWHARGIPGYSAKKPFPLATDYKTSQVMLADLIKRGERRVAGIDSPETEQAGRPLLEHLDDYACSLQAKGVTAKHVQVKISRIRRCVRKCGWKLLSDIKADRLQLYLAELGHGTGGTATFDQTKEHWTRADLAELLGIKTASISTLVKRHRLQAQGQGKARTYPRETARTLWERRQQGRGIATQNHYLRALREFCRWLVNNDRLREHPLRHLQLRNAETDIRRARRKLTGEELRRLLTATQKSQRVFRELDGPTRCLLYGLALGTGLREGELAALVPEWFQLAEGDPHITLPAKKGKNRKPKRLYLNHDLAAALAHYLAGRPAAQPLWPGSWAERGADMLKLDLEEVQIPYVVDGPDGPLYADFHALRHTFIGHLEEAGIPLRLAMELARHSDPKLTLKTYGKAHEAEKAAAAQKLPGLLGLAQTAGERSPLAELSRQDLEQLALAALVELAALGLLPLGEAPPPVAP